MKNRMVQSALNRDRRAVAKALAMGVGGAAFSGLPFVQALANASDAFNKTAQTAVGAIGEVLRLPLGETHSGGFSDGQSINGANRPRVWFENRRVVVAEERGVWWAWVALSLNLKPGPYALRVQASDGKTSTLPFEVIDKSYPEQRLIVQNARHVNPNPDDMARIAQEQKKTKAIYAIWNDDAPALHFQSPFPHQSIPLSSKFGLRRFFNGQPRNPHSGLDFAAPENTPIHPIAPGVVVGVGNFFFNGNSVFIHHGQGVVSFYCHLNQMNVDENTPVDTGTVIGRVGATGRVTAAHLHLGIYFSGVAVDPEALLGWA